MKRSVMDGIIDTIEAIAAMFVGLVAADIFLSVLLRRFFSLQIPDSYDFGRMLLGILIFWGIAATSYRGGHITVDLVWASASPRWKRAIDVFATLVLVGVSGYAYLTGGGPALKLIGQTSMRTVTDYQFGVIPMFLLMGAFVSNSGVSRELFRAANTVVGHWRGGLGLATVFACGGFAAISGSSVATAATFSTVAYPEMRRYGYPKSFATRVIPAGGTLGSTPPPSPRPAPSPA